MPVWCLSEEGQVGGLQCQRAPGTWAEAMCDSCFASLPSKLLTVGIWLCWGREAGDRQPALAADVMMTG